MENDQRFRLSAVSTSRVVGRAGIALAGAFAAILVAAPAASAESGFGPDADVTRSDDTGKVIFVATDPGAPIAAPAGISIGLARRGRRAWPISRTTRMRSASRATTLGSPRSPRPRAAARPSIRSSWSTTFPCLPAN